MNWPVSIGVIAGFVAGANLGVLLMVALRAGRRDDDAYDNAALISRIRDLETALGQQAISSSVDVNTAGQPEPTSVDIRQADGSGTHLSRPA